MTRPNALRRHEGGEVLVLHPTLVIQALRHGGTPPCAYLYRKPVISAELRRVLVFVALLWAFAAVLWWRF